MKIRVRHILIILGILLTVSSCQRPKGVIKRDDMSRIIEDMLLADYWISLQSADVRRQSDTTKFYEAVFNKYGYTLEDYLTSVDYYLNDPERFARMTRKMRSAIEDRRDKLQAEVDAERETPEEVNTASKKHLEPKDSLGVQVPKKRTIRKKEQ